jgi:hypothetical protein
MATTKVRLEDLRKAMLLIDKETADYSIEIYVNTLNNLVICYYDKAEKKTEIEIQHKESNFESKVTKQMSLDALVKPT